VRCICTTLGRIAVPRSQCCRRTPAGNGTFYDSTLTTASITATSLQPRCMGAHDDEAR
jgi:hypothetical protein